MSRARKLKTGIWTLAVQYNRFRKKLTLGTIDSTHAKAFAANLDLLIAFRKTGQPLSMQLEEWCSQLSPTHRQQLSELELVDEYYGTVTVEDLIKKFLEDYDSRHDLRQSTKIQFRSTMTNRVPKFLKQKTLQEIEPKKQSTKRFAEPQFSPAAKQLFKKVESWQREHFSKATWSKANGRLREVGRWAVAAGIVDYNPFVLLPKPGEVGEIIEIPTSTVLDAMANCIDPDTRLLFALGRFGAFRVPKEARSLRPGDIDWEAKTIRILDCKKLEYRTLPLFEILETELRLHQKNSKWERYVLSHRTLGKADANNYNLMKEAVVRAGFEPWADLRRNLRSSAINDFLAAGHPENKVVAWVGHSVATSRKHYQSQTAESIQADAGSMSW